MTRKFKGYSIETIKKCVSMLTAATEQYKADIESGKTVNVCISKYNKKIGHVMNVSLAPILTCPNCTACHKFCYDIKAVLQYSNTVLPARARNTALVMLNRDEYFNQIDKAMSRRRTNKFMRFHVSGDMPDYDYFCRFIELAKKYPDFVIWTYTKNYKVVNQYVAEHGNNRLIAIPHNVRIMFSKWDGMDMPNPYGFKAFYVELVDDDGNFANVDNTYAELMAMYHCPGNCDICKEQNRGCIGYEDTVVKQH